MTNYYIITYDIEEDRDRNKIMKILKDYGNRLQYSVYQCNLDEKNLMALVKKLQKRLRSQNDSIIVFKLCNKCYSEIRMYGSKKEILSRDDDDVIIV